MCGSSAISRPSFSPAPTSPTISSTSASTTRPRRPCASWASTSRPSSNRRKSRASATAAWAVWPPASWIPWLRSIFPPSATASATSTASSIRKSAMAGRWRQPISGFGSAIPGLWSGPRMPSRSNLAATLSPMTDGSGQFRVRWIPQQSRARHPQRHSHPRLPHQHRQYHAPLVRAGRRILQLRQLQHRRFLRRRGATKSPLRTSPKSFTPTTKRSRASNCAWSSSSSSSPAPCSTSSKSRRRRSAH